MVAGRDAVAAGRGPVDGHVGGEPLALVVAGHVGHHRRLRQRLGEARHPGLEIVEVRGLEDHLVLGRRDRGVDRQVLDRLHVEAHAALTFAVAAWIRRMIAPAEVGALGLAASG